ncbi:hypothetical protein ASC66_10285 [Leifsonia sp. Root4]|uniref:ATP-binding cassette domain-containing protein n=1 Tax=Leifsonia sp. Root4 TaxID=1736525 RepID=UPI000701839A|nr:ABC transporter ATP-binding protein [Leifsonia sp. Root4]KQW05397.1 hypothetical protein ASC66_10285 [Leifsonia sp. Root4]
MRFHAAPLRTAAIVAAVFVATRVVYRVVFGGASGGGILLLDLPSVQLAGPFAHVSLFGPVTSGGLWNAAVSALPFAAVILAFGLLSSVVDMQRLFVRGSTRGPLRAISRSLVIAWSTAPALAHAVRRVRRAAALRGERGAAALLVPVFEQTIERALGLAASMEVRGFASTHPAVADATQPVVAMTDAALAHDSAEILGSLTLTLDAGTLTVLTGPTGSGKSSLLRSIDGLFQHFDGGRQRGRITVAGVDRAATPPRDTAAIVGSVAQNVRIAFAAQTVQDEIGFALAVRGLPADVVAERVAETARSLGIGALLSRDIDALSTGEATLVAIAAAISGRPALLLVDEPLAELDDAARDTVCRTLDALAHEHGLAVVVAEHHSAPLEPFADRWLALDGGRALASAQPPPPVAVDSVAPAEFVSGAARHPLAELRNLTVSHAATAVVRDAHLTLDAGELVALAGRNGAGKSSLLLAMAMPDAAGHLVVRGEDVARLPARARRSHVALVPERVDELFFHTTVAAECLRADRADRPERPTVETFAALLGGGRELDALLLRHPRDLSAGQQLCLALAIQLAPEPALLLVDEPSRGLDEQSRALVGAALRTAAASGGRAVLIATHDAEFARRYAGRTLTLADGTLDDGTRSPTGVSR